MNTIDALRIWSEHLSNYISGQGEFWGAHSQIVSLIVAYDALAPDWSQAPEWSKWSAIHANGLRYWFQLEPECSHGSIGWNNNDGRMAFANEVELPFGVDWRLLKWQCPEVAK